MKQHKDYITHINNEEDYVYLKTAHFPVNMRLFHSSPEYKAIILQQCEYLKMLCLTKMEGYKKPHGMSSANAGLGFNIIAIAQNRGKKNEDCLIMINPTIIKTYGEEVDALSNCGSLTLKTPITVKRYPEIRVEFYCIQGIRTQANFTREEGAFTIQHEIDHNIGVLITDL